MEAHVLIRNSIEALHRVRAICDVYNYRNKKKLPDISSIK